jgi:transposase InsO family protein
VLPDEQKPTVINFLSRGVAWFNSKGIECRRVMSDNGPAYFSKAFAKAGRVLKLRHVRTRPYAPRTNGKAERFIQTLCKEWAYAMAFPNSEERNRWRPRYMMIYTSSGSTRPWAGVHLSRDSLNWWADEPGETQQLGVLPGESAAVTRS